jgi:hypothetical protein
MKIYILMRQMYEDKLAEITTDAFSTLEAAKSSVRTDYNEEMIPEFEWEESLDYSLTDPETGPRMWIGEPENGSVFVIREVEVR